MPLLFYSCFENEDIFETAIRSDSCDLDRSSRATVPLTALDRRNLFFFAILEDRTACSTILECSAA